VDTHDEMEESTVFVGHLAEGVTDADLSD